MMDGNGIVSKEKATCIKTQMEENYAESDFNASCLVCQLPNTSTPHFLFFILFFMSKKKKKLEVGIDYFTIKRKLGIANRVQFLKFHL